MADIIKKVNALGLLDQYTIAKSLGQEDEFCKSFGIDIEKGGKAAAIGEIREFGGKKYQKQANGWRPVKKGDQKSEGKKEESSKGSDSDAISSALGIKVLGVKDNEAHSSKNIEAKQYSLDMPYDRDKEGWEVGRTKKGKGLKNQIVTALNMSEDRDNSVQIYSAYDDDGIERVYALVKKKKESSLDLSKHSKQDLLDAMTARAKSGVSESDPEMKQLQAELDKRGAEKKPHDYVKDSPNALVQESIDKFADKKGKAKFDAVVQDLLSQNVDPEKIKSGLRNLRPGHTVGEDSSFVDKEFNRVAGSKSTHIGDMSKEQKFAAAAKFGIENPEKLSTKELDKQLVDKNIEAELKKFKESKGEKSNESTFKSKINLAEFKEKFGQKAWNNFDSTKWNLVKDQKSGVFYKVTPDESKGSFRVKMADIENE